MTGLVEREITSQTPIVPAKDINEAVRNLLRDGWTRLAYPPLAQGIEYLIPSFIWLLNDKARDDYVVKDPRENDGDDEPDLGLIFKARGQLKIRPRPDEIAEGRLHYDTTKAVHHFHPRLLAYLGRNRDVIERHANFFLESARLHALATHLATEVAEEMDCVLPGYRFAERVRMRDYDHKSRFLHYACDGPRDEIATRHRDKCFITVHARSSRGGLWLVDNSGVIVRNAEETRADSILLFFGREAWEITQGVLRGIVHGVKDTTFTHGPGRTPRQTLVSFITAHVRDEERAWAQNHLSELAIPPHVDHFAHS